MKRREYEEEFVAIFGTACGYIRPEYQVEWVENARQVPSDYAQGMAEFYAAQQSLCRRFGIDLYEDEDLCHLSSALATIERDVAHRLFHCGIQFAHRPCCL